MVLISLLVTYSNPQITWGTLFLNSIFRQLVDWKNSEIRVTTWCHHKTRRTLSRIQSRTYIVKSFQTNKKKRDTSQWNRLRVPTEVPSDPFLIVIFQDRHMKEFLKIERKVSFPRPRGFTEFRLLINFPHYESKIRCENK